MNAASPNWIIPQLQKVKLVQLTNPRRKLCNPVILKFQSGVRPSHSKKAPSPNCNHYPRVLL